MRKKIGGGGHVNQSYQLFQFMCFLSQEENVSDHERANAGGSGGTDCGQE